MVAERKRPEKKALQQKASEKQVSKKRKAVKQNTSKKKKRSLNSVIFFEITKVWILGVFSKTSKLGLRKYENVHFSNQLRCNIFVDTATFLFSARKPAGFLDQIE